MSSTYSPDLRIELIGTGDQAGVWGTTTNINLGTLLESAIAGYTSVSVTSANQALTANNGAADESRNAAIALTTITSANFAVYAPPASKLYVIYNTTAYTATIYNSTVLGNTTAAGTGVAIPAGKTMTVWSDGTNMAQQNTHLISPSLSGTPTTPTAATGTNTTQIASTAFVQATLLASVYPVGSIYINASSSTNPGTLLGFGTWAAFGAGRVMVGFDGTNTLFDTAEETGGSYDAVVGNHTHTYSGNTGTESANHVHNVSGNTGGQSADHYHGIQYGPRSGGSNGVADSQGGASPWNTFGTSNDHTHAFNVNSGGVSANHTHAFSGTTADANVATSVTNKNIQPYITVYMWKRTA